MIVIMRRRGGKYVKLNRTQDKAWLAAFYKITNIWIKFKYLI